MLTVRNGDVWAAKDALAELIKEPWPVKTAYGLAKLARRVGEQYSLIDQVRTGIIRQYGTTGENGQVSIQPDSEHWGEFVAAFNEMMNEEAVIECAKVRLPDSRIELLPKLLMALEPFIEMLEDDAPQGNSHASEPVIPHLVAVQ